MPSTSAATATTPNPSPSRARSLIGRGESVGGRVIIRTRRSARGQCPPLVYLDGTLWGSTLDFDINQIDPDILQGIEAYSGPAQVPAEFNRTGAECGVILIWTRFGQ